MHAGDCKPCTTGVQTSCIFSLNPTAPAADGSGGAFVLTPAVQGHLRNLARAVLLRRYPILLQVRGMSKPCMVQPNKVLAQWPTYLLPFTARAQALQAYFKALRLAPPLRCLLLHCRAPPAAARRAWCLTWRHRRATPLFASTTTSRLTCRCELCSGLGT